MATEYNIYRIYCSTENAYKTWILAATDDLPSTCPTNTAHTIIPSYTVIESSIKQNTVSITQMDSTDHNYAIYSMYIEATGNSTVSDTVSWPYTIAPISIGFTSLENQLGDELTLVVGEKTTVAIITSDIVPASAWTSQNYTTGQKVLYTHPTFGERVYTCIQNTINNEIPLNITYWRLGYEIVVTSVDNITVGYMIHVSDGTNENNVDVVNYIDKINKKIYVMKNPTNSFVTSTPTYVKISIYIMKDFAIGHAGEHSFCANVLKALSIPSDVQIKCYYKNKTADNKIFVGKVEYFY